MSPTETIALILTAAAAGAMNAIAGGGTLLTFPALLFFGMPAIQANATSTLALLIGIGGSVYGYRGHLAATRPWMIRFAPVSVAGGLIGAWLLTCTSEKLFAQLVPFLILFATVLFIANNAFRRLAGLESIATSHASGARFMGFAIALQFLVSVYGGYFGAGIGILMLATLGFIGLHHIHEMNTIKTLLGALINLVAAGYFVWAGLIRWPEALLMTIGAGAGYYLGSTLTQRIPQKQVRRIIAAIGLGISAVMFYRQFVAG